MSPVPGTTRHFIGKDIVFIGGSEGRQSSFQAGLRCGWDDGSSKWIDCFPPHNSMCIICRKTDCFAVVYPLAVPSPHTALSVVDGPQEGNSMTGVGMLLGVLALVCWAATCIAIGMVGTQNDRLLYGMCKQRTSLTYPPDSNRRET